MLFFGNVGADWSYWAVLPLGIVVSGVEVDRCHLMNLTKRDGLQGLERIERNPVSSQALLVDVTYGPA
jgi:hypothetical protein